jgi:hypothetical protein
VNPSAAARLYPSMNNIPATVEVTVVLRDGIVLASRPGAMSGAGLDKLVNEVRNLDMDEVRGALDGASGIGASR